ncbi:hypothetical protein GF337_19570 [candidate division KSB1 bacterium]|nr:hypothetical protein [candidate division KSB1 bacterium]
MFKIQRFRIFLITALLTGCASNSFRFKDAEPVMYFNDIHPIPSPESVQYERFDYYANVLPELPRLKHSFVRDSKRSMDVNSMDEVPASSWFIPRLGFQDISPEELVNGPVEYGPPQPPLKIIRVRKRKQNPRLFVRDRRGIYYLLKFDPPDFPGIATTTSFIVNRLFWGFGYHVPEDHSFYFKREDLIAGPEIILTDKEIDQILSRVAGPVNGYYRSISSRIIEGYPLGPTPAQGVRPDDPNDLFPHENRRVLRALHVFCAFTNMCDISSDNTLDMYVGEKDKGYIKHYLVDFDDAFGTHAARTRRLWAGYNHLFSFNDIMKNLFTIGLIVEDWENLDNKSWKSVGSFEGDIFDPAKWKETHPYQPIRKSQQQDDYWAAKKIGALTEQHIKALVKAANYPEPQAEEYIIQTLLKRRHKILRYFLCRVSPAEFLDYKNSHLHIADMGRILLQDEFPETRYEMNYYDDSDNRLIEETILTSDSAVVNFPIAPYLFEKANNYLRVDVKIHRKNMPDAEPAQFHLLRRNDQSVVLVGVVH